MRKKTGDGESVTDRFPHIDSSDYGIWYFYLNSGAPIRMNLTCNINQNLQTDRRVVAARRLATGDFSA